MRCSVHSVSTGIFGSMLGDERLTTRSCLEPGLSQETSTSLGSSSLPKPGTWSVPSRSVRVTIPPRFFTPTVTLASGTVAPLVSRTKPKYEGPSSSLLSSSSPKPAPPAHAAIERAQVIASTAPTARAPPRTGNCIQPSWDGVAAHPAAVSRRDSLACKIGREIVRQDGQRPNRDDTHPSGPQPLVPLGGREKADRRRHHQRR